MNLKIQKCIAEKYLSQPIPSKPRKVLIKETGLPFSVADSFSQRCQNVFECFSEEPHKLRQNVYFFGKFWKNEIEAGIKNHKIKQVLDSIKDLLSEFETSAYKENSINLINIIYSTVIKSIQPKLIIKGIVSPNIFRKLIDDSIKMYRQNVLSEDVDYRHILGRMVSFRDTSETIRTHFHYAMPEQFEKIAWTSNEQLDMIGIIEKIKTHRDDITSNFMTKKVMDRFVEYDDKLTDENLQQVYNINLMDIVQILRYELRNLMLNPHKNIDEIKDKIELAYFYFDKIPFDYEYIPRAWANIRIIHAYEKVLEQMGLIDKDEILVEI